MEKLKKFVKNETVLIISALLAIGSMLIITPNAGYMDYLNLKVLTLLFCLMASVAGFQSAGLFDRAAQGIAKSRCSAKVAGIALILICFFSSALITNDVALITFVPFTIGLLGTQDYKRLISVIVLETVAANLGSVITPIGNPQNLFIYTQYDVPVSNFMQTVLPLGAISLAMIMLCAVFMIKKGGTIESANGEIAKMNAFSAVRYAVIFIISILAVLGIVDYRITLAATVLILLIFDRKLFAKIDYSLLITFVCFFIFVGNLGQIEAVGRFISEIMSGRELLLSALVSQIISNVPAAAMLSAFTQEWRELLLGVNIGGLGTPIASMASIISLRLYAASDSAKRGRYIGVFLAVNFAMLAVLLCIYAII